MCSETCTYDLGNDLFDLEYNVPTSIVHSVEVTWMLGHGSQFTRAMHYRSLSWLHAMRYLST